MASFAKSIAKVGSNSLLTHILGFVRDLGVARVFCADVGTDAFLVAFNIPNVMRRLFAGGAFSIALVPVLKELKAKSGFEKVNTFIDDVMATVGTVSIALSPAGLSVVGTPSNDGPGCLAYGSRP